MVQKKFGRKNLEYSKKMKKVKVKERQTGGVPEIRKEDSALPKEKEVLRGHGSSDDLKKLLPQPESANILEQEVGKADNNNLLPEVLEKLDKDFWSYIENPIWVIDELSEKISDTLAGRSCKSDEIQAFIDLKLSKRLSGNFFKKPTENNEIHRIVAGLFISSLITQSPEKEIKLNVKKVLPMDHLCFQISGGKKVFIEGDVGNSFGEESTDSILVVNGNGGKWVGEKIDGATIVVKGHVKDCGKSRKSGNIIVEEDLSQDDPWDKDFCGVSTPDHIHVNRKLVGKKYVKNWRKHLIEWEKQKSKSGN